MNVFLVGRKGVGKTMLLKLFEPSLVALLNKSSIPEHVRVRELLPAATVGIYFNLAGPEARLQTFQGRGWSDTQWRRAYGDYLNWILVRNTLDALDQLFQVDAWRRSAGVHVGSFTEALEAHQFSIELLKQENSFFQQVSDLTGLREAVQTKIQLWARFLNADIGAEAPSAPLALGLPLFHLMSGLRRANIAKTPLRLFVMVDQYEALHQRRGILDLRPIFNQAMYEASRGGTGVEFKIGTRAYSYENFQLGEDAGSIEIDREFVIVDLDRTAIRFYPKFAVELFQKRLSMVNETVRTVEPRKLAEERLPSLSPHAEAKLYVRDATGERVKHLAPLIQRWERLGFSKDEAQHIVQRADFASAEPLTSMLAGIALTRWLRDNITEPPLKMEAGPPHLTLVDTAIHYGTRLISSVDLRYSMGTAKARRHSSHLRAIDDFVRDAEDAALFQLASAYKNQRRYFAGVDSMIAASSNVALVFIEALSHAYDNLLLDGRSPATDPVPPAIQTQALDRVSQSWYRRIPKEYDLGETLQELLRGLGASLRKLQLEITVPQPSPNGFSIEASASSSLEGIPPTSRADALALLHEAISWGLLEEALHQDKTRGRPTRRKVYINRVLSPYFGLSLVRRKDPIYVKDLQSFVQHLLDERDPLEVARLLTWASGARRGKKALNQSSQLLLGSITAQGEACLP